MTEKCSRLVNFKMKIAAWQKSSFIDYEGKSSAIVFTAGCNYNCGYCHNPESKKAEGKISEEEIFDYINYINNRKKLIDAVVISGGEPTIQLGLKNFVRKLKDIGLLVKLDTNGSNYGVLQELKEYKLVDYVAMDVKCPMNLYAKIVGRNFIDERDDVGKGIAITSQFPDYEFRTTIVPIYENEKPRWISLEEIGETAKLILNWSSKENESRYFLQPFKAIEKKNADERFSKEHLPREMWETPMEHLEKCLVEAQKHLPNAKIRGQ